MVRADWAEVEGLRVSLRGGWNRSVTTYLLTSDTTYEGTNGDHGYLQLDAALDRRESAVRLNAYARREHYPVRTVFRTAGGPLYEMKDTIEDLVYDFEAQRSVRPFDGNVLTYGLSGRASYVSARKIFGDHERTLMGSLFIQDEYRIFEWLDLTASLRWDDHSEAGTTVSPRGSLVFAPLAGHVFRALVGQAYLNPDNVQNYTSLEIPTNLPSPNPPVVTVTGDEDLRPQKQVSFELDYETTAIPGAVLETSVFYAALDDLIVFVPPPTTDPDNYLNSGRIELYGGEASANLRLFPWLRGFVNYAYVHVNNTYRWISPKHQVNAGARLLPSPGVSLSATVHWTSRHRFTGLAAMPADRDLPGGTWVQGRIAYETARGEVGAGEVALWFMAGESRREFPRGDEIGYRFGFTVAWAI
ncbi:MAG: TonB-dependent receptor [Planctomycetales bacterium]|nr:TonB-dependent receptor [Planctomycetales bacterium]